MLRLRFVAAILPIVLLSGCFQLRALVRMNDDGSGTLEETVLFGEMVRQLMTAGGDTASTPDLYHIDSLRAHAARLGDGVTLLRVDSLQTDGGFGYRAVYSFSDVSSLRFRFNPNPIPGRNESRNATGSGSMLAATTPDLSVTFARGPAGELLIRMPQPETTANRIEPDRAAVAALADSLRAQMETSGDAVSEMLGGIRMRLEVAGPGAVATTDAAFATDSSVVMFDYALGALANLMRDKPELVARVQLEDRNGDPDTRPVLRALAGQPDVRYELRPEVTVRFAR